MAPNKSRKVLTISLMPVSLPAGSLGRDEGREGGGTIAAVPRGVVGLLEGGPL